MAKRDFKQNQPAPQNVTSNLRDPKSSGVPQTGFSEAPKGKCGDFGPGQPIRGNGRKIH